MPTVTSDIITTADNSPGYVLGNFDRLLIARDATLATSGNNSQGVRAANGTRITVSGEIATANSDGISFQNGIDLIVNPGGSISAYDDAVIGVDYARVTNAGTIAGAFGLYLYNLNSSSSVVNSGTIIAPFLGVLMQTTSSNVTTRLVNTGFITGGVSAGGRFSALNSGIIEGDFNSTGALDLVNTGTVAGALGSSTFDDRVDSSDGRITGAIFLGGGDDYVLAGLGANRIEGAEGNDTLDGGVGDDTLTGGTSGDELVGGAGFDWARFNTVVAASLADAGAGTGEAAGDSYGGIEGLWGSAGADTLTGDSGANRLQGGAGADLLTGGAGNDTLYVDTSQFNDATFDQIVEETTGGVDTLIVETDSLYMGSTGWNVEIVRVGSAATNTFLRANDVSQRIYGNAANNTIDGWLGDDRIFGGAGDDFLTGNEGRDRLEGGAGFDRFYFFQPPSAASVDTILDFAPADDTFTLSAFGFTLPTGTLAPSAFRVLGVDAGTAAHRILYNPAIGAVYWDADGNGAGASILFATVTPGTALTAADFSVI